jgi:hypothetical protein
MKQLDLFVLSVLTVIVAACGSSPAGAPSAPASPAIVCDTAQFQPPPPLTCGPAITKALAVLAGGHPPIVAEEFRWGGLCPPGAPCVPPMSDAAIVIIDFSSGPPAYVQVTSNSAGVVTATAPAPYPSGY